MKRKLLAITLAGTMAFLSGCVTTQGGGLSYMATDGEKQPIDNTSIKIKVPDDTGIWRNTIGAVVGDLVIPNFSVTHNPNTSYSRVFIENKTPESIVVHARNDNGLAGSGIKYNVLYTLVAGQGNSYQVTFTPNYKTEYKQGLIGKFPLPNFPESAVRDYLKSFSLVYKFEIDSKYNSESIMANFMRLAQVKPNSQGRADPITGKIFNQYFETSYRDKIAGYTVDVYPYRDGSKAVIHMELPAVETNANEIDFEMIINDLKKEMQHIVNS